MNLLSGVKVSNLWGSTSASFGSTGDAGGTTAGSTTNVGQSTGGGWPTASTGLDMQNFESALLIATVSNTTHAILKAGFSVVGTSAAVTAWTDLPGVYTGFNTTAPSTNSYVLALDVIKPTVRFINATVQVPTSSAVVESVIAIQYQPQKSPVAQATGLSNQTVIGSTAQ